MGLGCLKSRSHLPWVGKEVYSENRWKPSSLAAFGGLVCPTSLEEKCPIKPGLG